MRVFLDIVMKKIICWLKQKSCGDEKMTTDTFFCELGVLNLGVINLHTHTHGSANFPLTGNLG